LDGRSKTSVVSVSFNTANNRLIKNQKLINGIHLFTGLFLGLKPKVKVTKKSIAAFKIRPNIGIGTKNELHKYYLQVFYHVFTLTMLPFLDFSKKLVIGKKNKNYIIQISYGCKDINSSLVNSVGLNLNYLGGGNIM
jgi:hypothetical protein